MERITINAAVRDWIHSCFHHQKELNKKIEDYEKRTIEFDLEGCDNKKVIEILTEHDDAIFEDNELIYKAAITPDEFAKEQEDNQRRLNYMVKKINKAMNEDNKHKEQVKAYLKHKDKIIEGLQF